MVDANDLSRMVPGFDFLQGLLKNAGAGLPNMGQWVAPTLNPEELEKRISELKTVQFWLEQNVRLLATTVQALEVQRMTLSTLQSMNLPLVDLGNALKIKLPVVTPSETAPVRGGADPGTRPSRRTVPRPESAAATTTAAAAVDPLQWWGALTRQFSELAAKAVKDTAVGTASHLAGAVLKPSPGSARSARKKASATPPRARSRKA